MTTTIGYLPPYALLQAGLELSEDGSKVSMSRELFLKLMEAAAKEATFDEVWYRTEYPDVVEGIAEGHFTDELDHFLSIGYEEGRLLAYFEVDEEWYLNAYSDVARAIANGDLSDAESHYNTSGYYEGRVSDEATSLAAARWFAAIEASAAVMHPDGSAAEETAGEADLSGDTASEVEAEPAEKA